MSNKDSTLVLVDMSHMPRIQSSTMALPTENGPLQFAIQTTTVSGERQTLTSSADATAGYLTGIVYAIQDALNTRKLSASAAVWRYIDREFTGESSFWSANGSDSVGCMGPEEPGLENMLAHFRTRASKYPDWRLRYEDVMTEVDERAERATTFARAELQGEISSIFGKTAAMCRKDGKHCADVPLYVGMPDGVLRQATQVFEWRQSSGSWKCVKSMCIRGHGVS